MLQPILGFYVLFAWLISEQRRRFPVRVVIIGLALQLLLAILLFNFPLFQSLFLVLNKVVMALESLTTAGTSMVFGYLGGGSLPFSGPFSGSAYILSF